MLIVSPPVGGSLRRHGKGGVGGGFNSVGERAEGVSKPPLAPPSPRMGSGEWRGASPDETPGQTRRRGNTLHCTLPKSCLAERVEALYLIACRIDQCLPSWASDRSLAHPKEGMGEVSILQALSMPELKPPLAPPLEARRGCARAGGETPCIACCQRVVLLSELAPRNEGSKRDPAFELNAHRNRSDTSPGSVQACSPRQFMMIVSPPRPAIARWPLQRRGWGRFQLR